MRMIPARFVRVPRWIPCYFITHNLLIFQEIMSISKTCNQLYPGVQRVIEETSPGRLCHGSGRRGNKLTKPSAALSLGPKGERLTLVHQKRGRAQRCWRGLSPPYSVLLTPCVTEWRRRSSVRSVEQGTAPHHARLPSRILPRRVMPSPGCPLTVPYVCYQRGVRSPWCTARSAPRRRVTGSSSPCAGAVPPRSMPQPSAPAPG